MRAMRAAAAFLLLASTLGCARFTDRLAAELEPPAATIVLEEYPRAGDPDAVVFNDLPVRLYFFTQAPPEGTAIAKPVRVLFRMVAGGRSCREAGIGGLRKLQRVAVRARANAVVNVRATWEGEPLGDEARFGCRRAGDEYELVWEGALASVPEPPPPAAAPPPPAEEAAAPSPPPDTAADRLRELQELYYQGLVTREEFLERRQRILDGL